MNKIRAAVVGAGIYGKHHMNAYRHNPDTVLVAICDTDAERCDDLAMACGVMGYTRLETLLEEEAIDVVSVATPDPYHTESILTALRHGKHVLAEKPLATSVRECELIVEMAQQRDLLVGVDFHKRWDPAVMRIKAELEKPEAGRILRGHISMDDVITVPTEWLDWAGASSPVWFLGSHCFDLVRHFSGQEVVSVYAVGQKRLMVESGLDTFDSVQSLLTMADGSSWVVENSWVLPEGFPKDNDGRIDILCEATYIRSSSQHRGLEITTPGMTLTPNSYFINYRNGVASGFGIDPINDFVRAVIYKAPYPVTAVDGLAVSRICEAVHQSLESQKPVSLK
ncbi:Gfo/Idh/MocA family protein [Klebsiella quasipneumoniae]|uniref:Gfo/Idh/MocA family protein n=1 Tax=Klebsiella quasipneumoniae TaxID=1463165 RepID=UPI0035A5F82F